MPHLCEVHAKNRIKENVLVYCVYFCMVTLCVTNVNEDGWFFYSAIRVRRSKLWLCSRIKFFFYMWPLVLRNVEHIHHLLFLSFILDTMLCQLALYLLVCLTL